MRPSQMILFHQTLTQIYASGKMPVLDRLRDFLGSEETEQEKTLYSMFIQAHDSFPEDDQKLAKMFIDWIWRKME